MVTLTKHQIASRNILTVEFLYQSHSKYHNHAFCLFGPTQVNKFLISKYVKYIGLKETDRRTDRHQTKLGDISAANSLACQPSGR